MPRTKSNEDWLRTKILDVLNKFTIGGTEVTASAAELNLTDKEAQTVSADGAITIKNGVVKVTKAGVAAMTLANPTDVTDDNKELTILSTTAQAHTLTVTGGFGNGSTGEDVATFSGAIGDNINLKAYGGYWYITGAHQVAVA
jgi:hypothetical protein